MITRTIMTVFLILTYLQVKEIKSTVMLKNKQNEIYKLYSLEEKDEQIRR